MDLIFKHDIESNIFSTKITIDSFGTNQLSEDEEKELLSDFITKIRYKNLIFSKNVAINGTVPECVESGGIKVTLPVMSNREITLNKDFVAEYQIDTAKISPTAIDETVLTTKELVAQAYCIVFDEVIREAVENVMVELRKKAPAFAGEIIVPV